MPPADYLQELTEVEGGAAQKQLWFADQYEHPHESKHTIGEVLGWFDRTGFEFLNSIPNAASFEARGADEELFRANPRGTALDRLLVRWAADLWRWRGVPSPILVAWTTS